MPHPKPITRRRFLLIAGGTALSALLGAAYLKSGCPLSDSGVCVGPRAAYIDLNRDDICDRVQGDRLAAKEKALAEADTTIQARSACPFGLVNDPYPGRCRHYVDANGNGICDLSEPGSRENPERASEEHIVSELHEER